MSAAGSNRCDVFFYIDDRRLAIVGSTDTMLGYFRE
jgi:hypothetical protein